jgi:putative transposase
LPIARQCELLGISRSAYYYAPRKDNDDSGDRELTVLLAIMDELREHPFYGYRKIALAVAFLGVTRKQVRRIMKKAGLRAIYPGKRLSQPDRKHQKYPYLLKDKVVWLPNQVWASDITYIRLKGGYVYLVTILDVYSRKVLAWRLSNTSDAEFCVRALEDAIESYGVPAIMNTDQGCQYTSVAFTSVLIEHGIQISMDSVNRALDNIYVERLWRSLKYEDIYLRDYRTMLELRDGLTRYFTFYNGERFHESLGYETPDYMYNECFSSIVLENAA